MRATETPVTEASPITAGSDAELDRKLVERLRDLGESDAARDECFAPLGGVVLEAILWIVAATVLWIVVALWSL